MWAWYLDRKDGLMRVFGLDDSEFMKARENPHEARIAWQKKLETLTLRQQEADYQEWKATLAVNGAPTPKLYQWIKGGDPSPPLAVMTAMGVVEGPHRTLEAIQNYWKDIMCRDADDARRVREWIAQNPVTSELLSSLENDTKILKEVMRTTKAHCSGVRWMAPGDPETCSGKGGPMSGYDLYGFRGESEWPETLTLVRTHMLAKPLGDKKALATEADWRPIAISSVWVRLWSRWKLATMSPQILDCLSPELRGGLPGRHAQGSMLSFLAALEQALETNEGDHLWCAISVDASKCFDRIDQERVLRQAQELGVEGRTLRGVASFLLSIRRNFSCGPFLGGGRLRLPTASFRGTLFLWCSATSVSTRGFRHKFT